MMPTLALAGADVLSGAVVPSFAVRHSPEMPTYYELALKDGHGDLARWVIPLPLKRLAKRPVLLWRLSAAPMRGSLSCLETGSMRLVPTRPGTAVSLRSELDQGLLRLSFNGQLLRGYYRLQCLPTGCGQLWQLTPIGCI